MPIDDWNDYPLGALPLTRGTIFPLAAAVCAGVVILDSDGLKLPALPPGQRARIPPALCSASPAPRS